MAGQGLSIALPTQSGEKLRAPEIEAIRAVIQDEIKQRLNRLHLVPQTVEPEKPRTGDVVYADAAYWDPGLGEGIYRFDSTGNWIFLG